MELSDTREIKRTVETKAGKEEIIFIMQTMDAPEYSKYSGEIGRGQKLVQHGRKFETNTDTESIVKAKYRWFKKQLISVVNITIGNKPIMEIEGWKDKLVNAMPGLCVGVLDEMDTPFVPEELTPDHPFQEDSCENASESK